MTIARVVKFGGGTRRREANGNGSAVLAWNLTAAKTIAAVGGIFAARINTFLTLWWAIFIRSIVRATFSSRILGIAFQIPIATIIPLAAIAIEKTILLTCINVVATDSCGETSFVVIKGASAFRVLPIYQPVAIVINAVTALGSDPAFYGDRFAVSNFTIYPDDSSGIAIRAISKLILNIWVDRK